VQQNHVFVVRCGALLNGDFLSIWMASPRAKAYLLLAGKQTTNLASINRTQLSRMPVLLPRRDEQDEILRRVEALDERIRTEGASLSKYSLLKAGLMEDLLTGAVRVTEASEVDAA
jgi:type I restriction enzyme, S subunit